IRQSRHQIKLLNIPNDSKLYRSPRLHRFGYGGPRQERRTARNCGKQYNLYPPLFADVIFPLRFYFSSNSPTSTAKPPPATGSSA
ncbi:hypothetical protein ACJ4N4_002215, partial [Neisseria gonorrhoeae]